MTALEEWRGRRACRRSDWACGQVLVTPGPRWSVGYFSVAVRICDIHTTLKSFTKAQPKEKTMRFPMRWILAAMLLGTLIVYVAAPAPIRAQVTTATIYGTVIDSSGARIPGVTVNLTQQETGTVTTKITTETGDFQFDFIRAGTYTIPMELSGFKTYKESAISLGAGQSVRRTY